MNTTHKSKISRLPHALRERLNQRLRDGEGSLPILEWLNGLLETREILNAEFGGRDISEQNLSHWRLGGYREWLNHLDATEALTTLDTADPQTRELLSGNLGEKLAQWTGIRLAATASALTRSEASPEDQRKEFRQFLRDLVLLRRSENEAARTRLEAERLEFDREKHRKSTEEEHLAWAIDPANEASIQLGSLTRKKDSYDRMASAFQAFQARAREKHSGGPAAESAAKPADAPSPNNPPDDDDYDFSEGGTKTRLGFDLPEKFDRVTSSGLKYGINKKGMEIYEMTVESDKKWRAAKNLKPDPSKSNQIQPNGV